MDDETMDVICQAYNLPGVHPAAELFPLIEGKEFDELCHSIGTHGLEQDIILTHDGYLLDGRNRLRACYRTGALERFKKLDAIYANDYVGYVVRLNLNRRHLNESQRAVIAARLANMTRGNAIGSNQHERKSADLRISSEPQISQPKAAEMLNVSERLVQTVKAVERQAPELIEKIERGEITAGRAMEQVKQLPPKPEPEPPSQEPRWREDEEQRRALVQAGQSVLANFHRDLNLIEWASRNGAMCRIDRNSIWGNPFVLPADGDRPTVIDHYRWYLDRKPSLLKQLQQLRGKVLACWCYPDQCHGHVLLEKIDDHHD